MDFRTGHQRWARAAERSGTILDVEHLRLDVTAYEKKTGIMFRTKRHLAVVVMANGACYVDSAQCGMNDQYNRRTGYNVSVGRALKRAATNYPRPDFVVDTELSSAERYQQVRSQLEVRGLLR